MVAADLAGKLERAGYRSIGIACDGEDAVETARTLAPDLVLMDIRLSGALDGIKTAALTVVSWILAAAPVGVFALALGLGVRLGAAAAGAHAHRVSPLWRGRDRDGDAVRDCVAARTAALRSAARLDSRVRLDPARRGLDAVLHGRIPGAP